MRIEPGSTILGLPAKDVRDFLRRSDLRNADRFSPEDLALADQLIAAGLLEATRSGFQTTEAGLRVAGARVSKGYPRSKAEAAVAGLLRRAVDVNAGTWNPHTTHHVQSVTLFGSLTGDAAIVSDADVHVELRGLWSGHEDFDRRRDAYWANTDRTPRDYIEALSGSERHVRQHLQNRSKVISQTATPVDVLTGAKLVLLQDGRLTEAGQRLLERHP
jgi:hypothetical protein